MKHFSGFQRSGLSFEDRSGDPDAFSAAIGRIAINFAHLEDAIAESLRLLLNAEPDVASIVTSELSFRQKVQMSTALAHHLLDHGRLTLPGPPPSEVYSELASLCFRAEELRNQILHSSWVGAYLRDQQAMRVKITAKARGLRKAEEEVDSSYLLDVADFIACVVTYIEETVVSVSIVGGQ